MGSSQGPPLKHQRHKDDLVIAKEGSTAGETKFGGPAHNSDRLVSMTELPIGIDDTAELTAPPPDRGPAAVATSPELISQLEALARDFAVRQNNGRESSEQCIETVEGGSVFSARLQVAGPPVGVSPRLHGSENNLLPRAKRLIGGRTTLIAGSFFMAVLIGVGATLAWHFHKPLNALDIAVEQSGSAASGPQSARNVVLQQPAPVTETAPVQSSTAVSPQLVEQLEVVKQDLAVVRRSIEELTAKQEQFEQLATTQRQFAARQEQMAQAIAKLQVIEQSNRQKMSPSRIYRAAPTASRRNPPRDAPAEPAEQLPPAPHPEPPRPPLPVPQ